MKTKCYPVKIKSIAPCGGAYLIEDYNGNKDYSNSWDVKK